jgi:hypothetical protein
MIDISTTLTLLIEILIWIGIIGGLIWILKKRNWSILKKAAITIIFAAGLIIAFIGLLAFTLGSSDRAHYSTQGSNLGKINYDDVIYNAQKAGYKVDGPYFVNVKQEIGVHPPGIKELDEQFGGDYRFLSGYFYSEKVQEINIAAVYSNLKGTSTNSSISPTTGEGSFVETFYSEDKKIGFLEFLVPNVRIIFQDKGHEYTITIDRLGGVRPGIKLSAGEKIPEEEYRGIFKQMFVKLGLPPEKVNEFKFEYNPTVW